MRMIWLQAYDDTWSLYAVDKITSIRCRDDLIARVYGIGFSLDVHPDQYNFHSLLNVLTTEYGVQL